MADHSKPTLSSTYTQVISEIDGRLDDQARMFSTQYPDPTNIPTGLIRWNNTLFKDERWNGTGWEDKATTYSISISGNAGTVTNGVYTNGSYNNPTWITGLAGSKISGNITGNAGSATQLATARNINGVSFDGTANIDVPTVNSVTFNNGGEGATSGTTFNGSAARTISYNTIGAPSTNGTGATGTWSINITGNALTATTASTAGEALTATTAAKGSSTTVPASTQFVSRMFTAQNVSATLGSSEDNWNTTANTLPGTGAYLLRSSAYSIYNNGPYNTGSTTYYAVNLNLDNSAIATQMAIPVSNSNSATIYFRNRSSVGTWNSWTPLLTPHNLNAEEGFGSTFQQWQTVTRFGGIWYQNTSGRPIMVSINWPVGGGASLRVGVSTTVYVTIDQNDGDSGEWKHLTAVIPVNHYYYAPSGDFRQFLELR